MQFLTIPKLSVVIATLGEHSLVDTINSLNNSTFIPDEILVCIPKECICNLSKIKSNNVKIVPTDKFGQVYQRSIGFKLANNEIVMQLDSDVILQQKAIEEMVDLLLELGPGYVVGPCMYDLQSDKSLHKYKTGLYGLLSNIYNSLICCAPWGKRRLGKVTKIGINYGIDPDVYSGCNHKDVDWLPGGCVLSYKNDLIFECFYNLIGRAYSEDLFHSYIRLSRGIKHVVSLRSKIYIKVEKLNFPNVFTDESFFAKRKFLELINGDKTRFKLYEFFTKLRRFIMTQTRPWKK